MLSSAQYILGTSEVDSTDQLLAGLLCWGEEVGLLCHSLEADKEIYKCIHTIRSNEQCKHNSGIVVNTLHTNDVIVHYC